MYPLVIIGPTASGKSALAMNIAMKTSAEIVSLDSRQMYKRLDIGTAKPSEEDRMRVPHHLIDVLELQERPDASRFARMAGEAVDRIHSGSCLPIIVGGAGLYLRALLEGLFEIGLDKTERDAFAKSVSGLETEELRKRLVGVDPESGCRINENDRYRIIRALEVYTLSGTTLSGHFRRHKDFKAQRKSLSCLKIGLDPGRSLLHERINSRTVKMMEAGWVGEVENLLRDSVDPSWPGMKTLGYPDVVAHITGELTRNAMIDTISARTRQYAKRQMTWFRKEKEVTWIDPGSENMTAAVLKLLDSKEMN